MTEDVENGPECDQHKTLTDQIADGKAIDWEKYESKAGTDKFKKIKDIEYICQAFTQTIVTGTTAATKKPIDLLFKWGHLQVIEKIGEGSFGQVYKAFDPILNREVALKLRHSDMASATGSRAFLQEARRLARVRHPNVIAVLGAAFEDDQVGIWTDLIAGQNLKAYAAEKGLLEINTALDLIRDISQALHAVHQANLIHGDVKSSNVMRQNNGVFKLMDFGAGSESIESGMSPLIGTPLLMAPELFKGESISPASDQYAFGVMLYQLLTGQYPMTASHATEFKQLHQKSIITSIRKHHPHLPKQLCELIDSLLSKKPHKRPSAEEVITQVRRIKDAPKRRRKIWALAAVITSLTLGVIISSWGYLNAVKSEQKALLAKQESVAVSNFLVDIMKSARPGESGKNTPIIEVLDMANKRLETSLVEQPLAKAEILHHIGISYHKIVAYDAAYDALKTAHGLRLKHLGKHHQDTLNTQQNLGRTLTLLTRFDEAEALLFIDNSIINSLPLKNHVRAEFLNAQSIYHSVRRNNTQAEVILTKILALIKKTKDVDYYHEILERYGNILLNLQKFSEAEKILNQVHSWAQNKPSKSALILKVRNNLIRLYGQTNRLELAEKHAKSNLQVATDWLGTEDFYVIQSMSYLSNVLNAQGKIEESEQVNYKALNSAKKAFGDTHWLTIRLMTNQANRLESLGQLDAAITQNLEAIEMAEKAFPQHNYSLLPWKNLTNLYYITGAYKEASELAQHALPFMIASRGNKHRYVYELRYLNGASLYYMNEKLQAVKELTGLLPEVKSNLGDDHVLVEEIKVVLTDSSVVQTDDSIP